MRFWILSIVKQIAAGVMNKLTQKTEHLNTLLSYRMVVCTLYITLTWPVDPVILKELTETET